ncbi:MAG: crotonase/enoyl-CoA hydratase family protein [Deltaproteobacteria bacterium]|nr:crotonase/enoyl-CoA hydratase family protein [Deltaproteobacteria bacterium]
MAYECFNVEIKDKVAHVQLSRPQAMNSMTRGFWRELPQIVRSIDREGTARAIVLSSTGKHFTAGMDLSVFASGPDLSSKEPGRARANLMRLVLRLQQTFSCLDEARVPILAAVQGGCIGGGVDMVSACDMRYATRDAFFCIQEINIGMTADVGTFPRLGYCMPQGLARELAYTGRRLKAGEAAACGFVNALFDDHAELLDAVTGIAVDIARRSPLAVWGSKEMLNYGRDHTIADSLRQIAVWQTGMFQPADMKEAFVAKSEGREPAFEDLAAIDEEF